MVSNYISLSKTNACLQRGAEKKNAVQELLLYGESFYIKTVGYLKIGYILMIHFLAKSYCYRSKKNVRLLPAEKTSVQEGNNLSFVSHNYLH